MIREMSQGEMKKTGQVGGTLVEILRIVKFGDGVVRGKNSIE